MPKPTVQRVTDIASRTAVVQPLQPKKSRKNKASKTQSNPVRLQASSACRCDHCGNYESDRLATASVRGFFAGVVRRSSA